MYIPQIALQYLKSHVVPQKVVVIYGARRVGKTTLLKKYLEDKQDYLFISGEDIFVRKEFASGSIDKLKQFMGKNTLLVIDEAQYIPDIGLNLKLIVDHIEGVRVIVTGSSSFDLQQHVGDPLTGRKYTTTMYPVSQEELSLIETPLETQARLEARLIYGSYPETILLEGRAACQEYLHELVSSYLCKDILVFEGIKKSQKLIDLLVLLAFQIGKEVSISELGTQLSLSKATVERYLDLLQKTFVIVNIRGFSRNLRKEVTKSSRYYFYDNGIRNSLINNFNPLTLREDVGALWENYLAIERLKKQQHQQLWSRNFFWRTYDQKELDWVEEREGKLFGYEFKWGKTVAKPPKLWTDTYENATYECITRDNYLKFIT
jgi:predicted AAA+ superfamily ATPase